MPQRVCIAAAEAAVDTSVLFGAGTSRQCFHRAQCCDLHNVQKGGASCHSSTASCRPQTLAAQGTCIQQSLCDPVSVCGWCIVERCIVCFVCLARLSPTLATGGPQSLACCTALGVLGHWFSHYTSGTAPARQLPLLLAIAAYHSRAAHAWV